MLLLHSTVGFSIPLLHVFGDSAVSESSPLVHEIEAGLLSPAFPSTPWISASLLTIVMSSSRMVIIFVEGDVVPIMFPVEEDGYADVSACRLALRFHMIPESIYIDQNIYDPELGVLSHTIGQSPTPSATGRTWRLLPRKFIAYGLKVPVHADSADLPQLQPSSSSF